MNYYERHLGDYAKDAGHLTMLEHGAYSLLLDRYYATEQGIPAEQAHRVCRARTDDEKAAVDIVLAEFFALEDGAWKHSRVEREISKMQTKVRAARENGKRGGRPKAPKEEAAAHPAGSHQDTEQKPSGFPVGLIQGAQAKALQTPDTSSTPIPPRGAKAAVSLKTWAESVKAKGEKLIPEDDAVFDYAATVGIPDDFLSLAWQEFRHRYSQPDAKRYRDWRQVFRKAVRGNWLKLWYCDQHGAYALTTVGIQAQRALAEAA